MFGKLFGRNRAETASQAEPELSADLRIKRGAIEQGRAGDPLIVAKVGAADINAWLMQAVTTERGVHVESLLVALGSLGGFSCQLAARHALCTMPHHWDHPWAVADGADGRRYFLGDAINHYALEGQYSLWSLAAGIFPQISDRPVPDLGAIVSHVVGTIGGGGFGEIRFPPGTSAGDDPINYVRHFWPPTRAHLDQLGLVPDDWPPAFGIAAQEVLTLAKDVVDPAAALTMIVESAVAMAKLDPAELGIDAPDPAKGG